MSGEVYIRDEAGTRVLVGCRDRPNVWRCTAIDMPAPKARTTYATVPGRDGEVDLSRALTGKVAYEPFDLSLSLRIARASVYDSYNSLYRLMRSVGGAYVRVTWDELQRATEEGAYVAGIASVEDAEVHGAACSCTVRVHCAKGQVEYA